MLRSRRLLSLLAATVAAMVLGACGSSSNSASSTGTVTVTRTVTASTRSTTTPSTTTRTTTKTAAAPSGPPACTASDLTPISLGSNGAAGTIVYGFALRDTGAGRCHTYGWPGAAFLSPEGVTLPTHVTRTTSDMVGTVKPTAIMLKPGQEASFRVTVSTAYEAGRHCLPASFLQIYAPDDTVAMRVAIGSGAQACGQATVTPLQPGTAAFTR